MEKENLLPEWFKNTLSGIGVLFLFETFRDSDWATLIPYIVAGYPILLLCQLILYSYSRKRDYSPIINPSEQIDNYSYRKGEYFAYLSLSIIGFFTLILLVDFRIYIHSAEVLIRNYFIALTQYSFLPVILYIIEVIYFAIGAFYLTVKIKPLWNYSDGHDAYKAGRGLLFVENIGNMQSGIHGPSERQYELALPHFDIAIKKGYDYSEVFSHRASCLHSLGFYFDALEDYNTAIAASNKYSTQGIASNYYMRSIIKDSLFDYEGGLEDIKEAIRLSKLDNADNHYWNEIYAKRTGISPAFMYGSQLEDIERKIKWEKRSPTEAAHRETELKKIKRREPKLS